MNLLDVRNLSVSFGTVRALDDVTLHVEQGEILAIVGANGAGKSTLLRSIMGLTALSAGAIEFAGQPIAGRRPYRIARLGIAYVPEGRGTLRQLTVRENLLMGAFSRRWDRAARGDFAAVLERFPILAQRLGQTAGTLSGGEQQMLVIGRALMAKPKCMLLDEPSLGLAPMIVGRICETVASVRDLGVTVMLVEQNAQAALGLADRAYVIENGRMVIEGRDLFGDPRIQEAYIGGKVEGRVMS
jgi:branched-chain amino acid transport system ATP-binding protein